MQFNAARTRFLFVWNQKKPNFYLDFWQYQRTHFVRYRHLYRPPWIIAHRIFILRICLYRTREKKKSYKFFNTGLATTYIFVTSCHLSSCSAGEHVQAPQNNISRTCNERRVIIIIMDTTISFFLFSLLQKQNEKIGKLSLT